MNDYSPPDEKTQLCRYVLWQHHNGTKPLTARQLGSPWDWIFKIEQVMKDGEQVNAYQLRGVKVPPDGEHLGHTVMLDQMR
mgnify:CR=1 FL=1